MECELITMSKKELERLSVLKRVLERRLTQKMAGDLHVFNVIKPMPYGFQDIY